MARAHIDLGWLVGMLGDNPIPTVNPAFGAEEGSSLYSPEGSPIGQEVYYDTEGNIVDPSFVSKYGTTSRYIPPTKWQQLTKPQASAYIDQLNNEYLTRPITAEQLKSIKDSQLAADASKARPYLGAGFKDVPDDVLPLLTGGDFRATTGQTEGRAVLNNLGGIANFESGTDINNAKLAQNASNAALDIQPTIIATQSAAADNALAKETGVTPLSIQLTRRELQGQLDRLPTTEELRGAILNNQLNKEKNIVPVQQTNDLAREQQFEPLRLEGDVTSQKFQNAVGDTKLSLTPYYKQTLKNEAVSGLAGSQRMPLSAEFSNMINNDGTITPNVEDPLGVNPVAQKMREIQGMQEVINGNKPQEITLSSGAKVLIPSKPVRNEPINPLESPTGRASISSTLPLSDNTSTKTVEQKPVLVTDIGWQQHLKNLPSTGERRMAVDSLFESLGKKLNIGRDYYGSSSIPKSYASTIRNMLQDPEKAKLLQEAFDNMTPEEKSKIYKAAMGE